MTLLTCGDNGYGDDGGYGGGGNNCGGDGGGVMGHVVLALVVGIRDYGCVGSGRSAERWRLDVF